MENELFQVFGVDYDNPEHWTETQVKAGLEAGDIYDCPSCNNNYPDLKVYYKREALSEIDERFCVYCVERAEEMESQ
ncbi:hypothetical protein [Endozoicomonas sp.]|uniref:hypothetical protein n=1 Tax=Endozoicomonas sp. TaxID=1892382 RepID=UPI00383AC33B